MGLADVPFYGAFREREQQIQQQPMQEMQQVSGALGVQDAMQKQQQNRLALARKEQYRTELSALGPSPTQEQLAQVAAKYTDDPAKLMDIQQRSIDKNATLAQQREVQTERLAQQGQYAQMMHEFRMTRAASDADRQAEVARHNKFMETIQTQARDLATQKGEESAGQKLQKQVEGLSKRGEDLTNLYSGIAEVNAVLTPYLQTGKSIPGLGYGSNASVMGVDVAAPFIGEEGKIVRSAIKNVANKILKAESGTAVTLPEEVRQNLALMATGQYSEKDFLNAWPRVVQAMQNNLDNVAAGYDPRAVAEYKQRGGSLPFGTKLRVPQRPQAPGAALPPPPPGFKVD